MDWQVWQKRFHAFTYTVPWNIALLTLGSGIFAYGVNSIVIPQGLMTGGVSGLGLLIYYGLGGLSPGAWYLLLNIPVFLMGWVQVGRKVFLYSLYGMFCLSACLALIKVGPLPIQDKLLAILAGGAMMGAGSGIALNSFGSLGGLDIIAIALNQRWNIPIGRFSFAFNIFIFIGGLVVLRLDAALYSLATIYVVSQVMDYFLGLFNQRKVMFIISDESETIVEEITRNLGRGCTVLYGEGGYTGKIQRVLMTVVNSIQLKRLEEIVFTIDPRAFSITTDTFSVIGEGFLLPKKYEGHVASGG
ncbi:Uncharacterized membrane-anchored protein YitT, contains DUF161 and DUF2179 domains [Desulfovibrionales bacterium]